MFEQLTEALSIKFNHSEDGSQFDLQSSPDKDRYSMKVKCFRCFGTHQLNCQECHGTQMISYNHPLAKLLDEVLVRKLNLARNDEEREEQLERVYPIKEQEEDSDEKKIICTFCDKQCQTTAIYSQQCPVYTCTPCLQKTPPQHHQFTQNIRISECEREACPAKQCKSCNCEIQNCYSICKTCLSNNYNYWICGSCSDSHSYAHPASHILQTAINFDINRSGRIELSSEIDLEESCGNSETYRDHELEEQAEMLIINRTSSMTIDIITGHPTFAATDSVEIERDALVASCVKLQIQGLFNSYEARIQIKAIALKEQNKLSSHNRSQKKQLASYASNGKSSKEQKQNIFSQTSTRQKADYVFEDYKCDVCGREPIINVRYHCRQCEDFDVCQSCYPTCKLHHEHCFQKIDGRLVREQAIQKLLESTNLQPCNKLKRGGSCYEPLNVRQAFEVI